MRVTTLNANGIRSAANKGFFDWFTEHRPDVLCLQEVRANVAQLQATAYWPGEYHAFYYDAARKGYSGVALYTRREPDCVLRGFGWPEFDQEARYLEARFGNLSIASIYVPSGSAGPERQAAKFAFLDRLRPFLDNLMQSGRDYLLCGDFNIAHRQIDLKNWRSNQKNSGFLPEERAFMDELIEQAGWIDAFRVVDPRPEQYTWWSNRGQAWAKNVGWRIDYHLATPGLGQQVRRACIYKDARFSDHAPLTLDYDYAF